jgi:spore coat protein A
MRHVIPLAEALEPRQLLSVSPLDPLTQPKFENPLPNPLDQSFIYQPTSGNHYDISIQQFVQSLGLRDPATGAPLSTSVWGYGSPTQPATYPGRSFVVQRDQQIKVRYTNDLVDAQGNPLPHLLPIDSTLHWADPLNQGHVPGPYTGPVPVVTHLHGGHTRSDSDGLPDAWFTPDFDITGRLFNEVYTYDNDQEAATLWYHDHALGITRLNVYAGLAGFYIVRDDVDTGLPGNPAGLPAGKYEIPVVIQDRMFNVVDKDDDGTNDSIELFYPTEPSLPGHPDPSVQPEFFGDTILVNGQAWPVLDVEPRKYRFRLLNGSDSRFYNMWINAGAAERINPDGSGPQIVQVGTDTGLLYAPVPLSQLTLAPGERADVVVDFSKWAGQTLVLRNNAQSPFPKGMAANPRTTGQIMAFRVNVPLSNVPDVPLAPAFRAAPISPATDFGPVARTRKLMLFEGINSYGRLEPMLGVAQPTTDVDGNVVDGTLAWDEPITENPMLGDTEVWEIYNGTADAHPIHLHLVSFQTLGRQKFTATLTPKPMGTMATGGTFSNISHKGKQKPPAANEAGWKDTVIMYPGEVTRIIATFDREGEYVWHCHILSHEDHEMMRPYTVGPVSDDGHTDMTAAAAEPAPVTEPAAATVFSTRPPASPASADTEVILDTQAPALRSFATGGSSDLLDVEPGDVLADTVPGDLL